MHYLPTHSNNRADHIITNFWRAFNVATIGLMQSMDFWRLVEKISQCTLILNTHWHSHFLNIHYLPTHSNNRADHIITNFWRAFNVATYRINAKYGFLTTCWQNQSVHSNSELFEVGIKKNWNKPVPNSLTHDNIYAHQISRHVGRSCRGTVSLARDNIYQQGTNPSIIMRLHD